MPPFTFAATPPAGASTMPQRIAPRPITRSATTTQQRATPTPTRGRAELTEQRGRNMKLITVFAAVLLATLPSMTAVAQTAPKPTDLLFGPTTGELMNECQAEYLSYDFPHCLGFIVGVVDGASVQSLGAAPMCAPKSVTVGQLVAIYIKYAKDHPDQWHMPASYSGYILSTVHSAVTPGIEQA